MVLIERIGEEHTHLLSVIATQSFRESHGSSAKEEDINAYIKEKYNEAVLKKELQDPANIYHILYYNNQPAGYSKIILDFPYPGCNSKNMAKLDRIFLLKEFYDLHLGRKLFDFNMTFLREHHQSGAWLFVWKENQRAIGFYKKNGFVIIGSHDFKISENHSNPNHQMLLLF